MAAIASCSDGAGRRFALVLAIVLFCAGLQGLADWVLFIGASMALRFVLGMGADAAMFQAPLLPWAFQVFAVVATPAAAYGALIGFAQVFGRGASFRYALIGALVIGIASVAVLTTLWPDHDPPEFPMRSIEIVKVGIFVLTGLACWWVVRRACSGMEGAPP